MGMLSANWGETSPTLIKWYFGGKSSPPLKTLKIIPKKFKSFLISLWTLLLQWISYRKFWSNAYCKKVLDSHESSEFPSDSCCIKFQNLSILKIKKYINFKNIYFLVPWKWMIWKTKRKLYKQIKQQVKGFPHAF